MMRQDVRWPKSGGEAKPGGKSLRPKVSSND